MSNRPSHFLVTFPSTLQVAPGVPKNRPQSGAAPLRKSIVSPNGHTEFLAQTWYNGLEMEGNTSINPFFYGTYLAETKPYEPVTRSKKQAFQADAVGVIHQLTPSHFERPHTFRLEWQPGPGGRLDWFVKGYRFQDENGTHYMEGDGEGHEWIHAFSLKDKSLSELMGSQIPIEPSYLIFNTAVSSTWGFPYDTPDWCEKCYDCDDPKCACAFYPGFCQMLRSGKTAMYIDHIRVYQSSDASAHVGANHTLGCDPPDYPTKEWISGHEYRYMRNPPFSYQDREPLRRVQRGGGSCESDADCGGNITDYNLTAAYEEGGSKEDYKMQGRGKCTLGLAGGMFTAKGLGGRVCSCNPGFTGPRCMTLDHIDTSPSAAIIRSRESPFNRISSLEVSGFLLAFIIVMFTGFAIFYAMRIRGERRSRSPTTGKEYIRLLEKKSDGESSEISLITGSSL
jgi:hypothetical protein